MPPMKSPVKWVVSISTAAWVNYDRSGLAVAIMVGSLVNSVISKLLKRLLNQSRPLEADGQGLRDPGMPSSHAHMLFFFAVYLMLLAPNLGDRQEMVVRISLLVFLIAVVTCIQRVKLKKHSGEQVFGGFISGSLGGYFWYKVCSVSAMQMVDDGIARFRASDYSWLEWPLLLAIECFGLYILTSGGRKLSTPSKIQ